MHPLGKREVALIRQRRVHQPGCVTLVLVAVREQTVVHLHVDLSATPLLIIPQLPLPRPLTDAAAKFSLQLFDNVDGVNQIEHETLHLELHHSHALDVKRGVLLELVSKLISERRKSASGNGGLCLLGKVHLIRETKDLRGKRLVILL